jgi:antitoxin VapB
MVYTSDIDREGSSPISKSGTAKLFRNGRSQAVRLPREFRFEGNEVRIRRVPEGVLLQPLIPDTATWFAELDKLNIEPFMKEGRKQPKTPRRKVFE